jgi:hypothetical protein
MGAAWGKIIFWSLIFLQRQACLSFMREKKSEREKLIFRSCNPCESQPFAAKARESMGRQNSLKARFL